jgi:hypothetical protein
MKRSALALLALSFSLVGLVSARPSAVAEATATEASQPAIPAGLSQCDPDGLQASGAVYRICMPPNE